FLAGTLRPKVVVPQLTEKNLLLERPLGSHWLLLVRTVTSNKKDSLLDGDHKVEDYSMSTSEDDDHRGALLRV
ncbi:hypothetical protein COCVIDRAFT_114839, partial [Bipolaris victoriae FI3]